LLRAGVNQLQMRIAAPQDSACLGAFRACSPGVLVGPVRRLVAAVSS
jgi:hypothetical protein